MATLKTKILKKSKSRLFTVEKKILLKLILTTLIIVGFFLIAVRQA